MKEESNEHRARFRRFLTLRGAASLLFGCAVLVWAISDQGALALSFMFYALADGLLALIFSFRMKDRGNWIFRAECVVSMLAAAFTLVGPVALSGIISHTGTIFLPYFITVRFIVIGMFEFLAIGFLKEAGRRLTIALTGIAAVAFGVLLIYFHPEMPLFTVMVGTYSVLIGFCLIVARFIYRAETAQSDTGKESARA